MFVLIFAETDFHVHQRNKITGRKWEGLTINSYDYLLNLLRLPQSEASDCVKIYK